MQKKNIVPSSMYLTLPFFSKMVLTVLIMKNREKGNDVINFWLLTCFPLIWKVFTAIICDNLYETSRQWNCCQRKKKGVPKQIKEARNHLLIEKMILRICRRLTGLGMTCTYTTRRHMTPPLSPVVGWWNVCLGLQRICKWCYVTAWKIRRQN